MSSNTLQALITTENDQEVNQANTSVLNKLKLLVGQKQKNEAINNQLLELIRHAEELPPSAVLNERLELTYLMLIGELPTDLYMDIAREVQEGPSLGLNILGGFMIALGGLMAVSGVIFLVGGIATLDVPVAAAGLVLLEGCLLSLNSGFGLFSPEKKGAPHRQMEAFCDLKRNADTNKINSIDDENSSLESSCYFG